MSDVGREQGSPLPVILTLLSVQRARSAPEPTTTSRSRRAARSLRVVVGASLLGFGLVLAEPVTTPAEAAGCQSAQIAVVVSFNSLGGGTQTSCIGDVGSGLAALDAAGFGYSFVPRQPGFICQIDGAPNPCNGAPVDAYWSYWLGSPGGSWSYSNLGAGNRNPAPGSAEGWSFGAGSPPAIGPPGVLAPPPPPPPPAPPAPAPAPAPTPGGGTGGSGTGGGGTGGGTSPSGEAPAPGASDSADPTAGPPGETAPGSSESADPTSAPGGSDEQSSTQPRENALQPASDSTPTGAPWAVLATIASLAVLGGAAYWQQRRRTSVPPGTRS